MITYYLKVVWTIVCMLFISAVCFALAFLIYQHQSSAAFQSAVVIGLGGAIHWAFWTMPKKPERKNEH